MNPDSQIPRKIKIIDDLFDPGESIKNYQNDVLKNRTDYGATISFTGTMRDFNQGDKVERMVLEHYPAMTSKQLNEMVDQAGNKWPIQHVLIIHRVGNIFPGEPIMMVVVWSAHRAAGFDACRFLMEELKHRAPFWKKEQLTTGNSRWVDKNTAGY